MGHGHPSQLWRQDKILALRRGILHWLSGAASEGPTREEVLREVSFNTQDFYVRIMLIFAIVSSHKQSGNSLNKHQCYNSHAFGRLTRKQDNILEVRSAGPFLSQSLGDLIPTSPAESRNPPADADVLYSFDAPTAPRKSIGLDSLVEKAERDFLSRETDKIVRNEYEILDESGEIKVMTKGKGKKGSPRQRAKVVATNEDEDEDDWEQI